MPCLLLDQVYLPSAYPYFFSRVSHSIGFWTAGSRP
jgi:hypothetical protein